MNQFKHHLVNSRNSKARTRFFLTPASFPNANFDNIRLFRTLSGLEIISDLGVLLSIPFYCGGKIVSDCHNSQSGTTLAVKKSRSSFASSSLCSCFQYSFVAFKNCICENENTLECNKRFKYIHGCLIWNWSQ